MKAQQKKHDVIELKDIEPIGKWLIDNAKKHSHQEAELNIITSRFVGYCNS